MSLLDDFQEFFVDDIEVFTETNYTSTIGTTEKKYPDTATRSISGYIQPISAGAAHENQKIGITGTHRLYMYATETLNDSDRIVYGGQTFQITFNAPEGISGTNDHKEVELAFYVS